MIIGLSGYIGSGKDTVAGMMQYLTTFNKLQSTSWELYNRTIWQLAEHTWEVKKFAGKLKQMVSLLTGIPVADLEKEEVKSSFLGPEWNRWFFIPKGTITQGTGYMEMVPFNSDLDSFRRRFKHVIDGDLYQQPMSVRQLLQELGTNGMRDVVHPNIHVNALFADFKSTGKFNTITDATIYPNWIISDVRFPNESQAIKDRGGIVIRVSRPVNTGSSVINAMREERIKHTSETSLDNWKFDAIINNDGTLEDLLNSTKEVLKQFNILT